MLLRKVVLKSMQELPLHVRKTILVNKYKINASRITAEGQGVGDMFTEPDWNRVSICTIED